MKLIVCPHCTDILRPSYEVRACLCGQINGRLRKDSQDVFVEGPAQIIELDDLSFHYALAAAKYARTPVPIYGHLIPREPANGRIQPPT